MTQNNVETVKIKITIPPAQLLPIKNAIGKGVLGIRFFNGSIATKGSNTITIEK